METVIEEQKTEAAGPAPHLMVDHEPIADIENQLPGWNDKIEETAKEIGEMSKTNKLMHLSVARTAARKYKRYMYAGMILGPSAGVLTAIGEAATATPDPTSTTFAILAIICAFISGIVVAITKFGKFDEVSSANKLAASRYTSLESNVRRQLALYRGDRPPGKQYLEWLNKAYDELFDASPLMPEQTFLKYTKLAEKEGRTVPNEYGKTISVSKEYEQQRMGEVMNLTDITVNTAEGESPGRSSVVPPPITRQTSLDDIKGGRKIKRSNTFAQFPELAKFSDSAMQYEMKRFMGF